MVTNTHTTFDLGRKAAEHFRNSTTIMRATPYAEHMMRKQSITGGLFSCGGQKSPSSRRQEWSSRGLIKSVPGRESEADLGTRPPTAGRQVIKLCKFDRHSSNSDHGAALSIRECRSLQVDVGRPKVVLVACWSQIADLFATRCGGQEGHQTRGRQHPAALDRQALLTTPRQPS